MKTRILAGVIGLGALMAPIEEARAYGPDCEATAAFHWAVAVELGLDADAAWEDAFRACNGEQTAEETQAAIDCQHDAEAGYFDASRFETAWVEYAPGGFEWFCGDAEGRPLWGSRFRP